MSSVFTKIIAGELPGHFVYRDDRCVAFLSINPLQHGHTLVVPVAEVDHWLDLDPDLAAHLTVVAQRIGQAQQVAFSPLRVGLMIAGLEVPHVHLHVVPISTVRDLDFANAEMEPDPASLTNAAASIAAALADLEQA
jgi:histidine triad (HIT) family protein